MQKPVRKSNDCSKFEDAETGLWYHVRRDLTIFSTAGTLSLHSGDHIPSNPSVIINCETLAKAEEYVSRLKAASAIES